MKIGFPLLPYRDISIATLYKLTKAINVSSIEFDSFCFFDKVHEQSFIQMIKIGMCPSNSIHAPYYSQHNFDLSSNEILLFDQFCENIQYWKDSLHLKKIVVHPPQDPNGSIDNFVERVSKLSSLGLLPCLENIPEYSWSEYGKIFEATEDQCPKLGICYDFGHDFLRYQQNAIDMIPEWVLKLILSPDGHLHLSGFTFDEDLHAPFSVVPIFKAQIFPKISQFFKNYELGKSKGTLILETAPQSKDQLVPLLNSYLDTWKLIGGWGYWSRWIRILIVRPFIQNRAKKILD